MPAMRALTTASLLVSFVLCATACTSEDQVPAYMSVTYQLRCLGECFNAPDNPAHSLYYVDGENDLDVRCSVSTAGGKDVLSFSTYCNGGDAACGKDRLRFEVSGLDFNSKDGNPGDSCQVTVREGSNEYESPCTDGPIKNEQRCQLKFKVNKDDSLVTGTLRCLDMANASSPNITRYLVAPNTENAVKFMVQGCAGL